MKKEETIKNKEKKKKNTCSVFFSTRDHSCLLSSIFARCVSVNLQMCIKYTNVKRSALSSIDGEKLIIIVYRFQLKNIDIMQP